MSKAFIAQVIQELASLTGAAANRAAGHLMDAIVKESAVPGSLPYPASALSSSAKPRPALA